MKNAFVTITFNGKKHVMLVQSWNVNGKTVVSLDQIEKKLNEIGCRRGDTFSIG